MVYILVPRRKRAVVMGNIKKPTSTKSTVTRLIRIFNVPERTAKKDWQIIERQMETSLPADYKELIDRVGGGYLERYMYILEPDCRNRHYDLADMTDERTEVNDYFFEIDGKPAELQTEGSFLIPWATTDNGEYLFWRCLPHQNPDKWTIMINQGRDGTWEYHDMNCTDFLYASLRKEVRSDILTDCFPLSRHVFKRFRQ